MKFATIVFRIASIWGFLIITPLYFMASTIGQQNPPAITHLEYFYGFLAVTLVWQLAFFVIATDPVRFRPFIFIAILEKLCYIITIPVLYAQHLVAANQLIWVGSDSILCLLFVLAWRRTSPPTNLAH